MFQDYPLDEKEKLCIQMLKQSSVEYYPLYRYEEEIVKHYEGIEKYHFTLDKTDLREKLNFKSAGFFLAFEDLERIINASLEMIENKAKKKIELPTQKRLSSEQIKELKKLYRQGYTKTSIAEKFGISVNSVTYHVGKRKKIAK